MKTVASGKLDRAVELKIAAAPLGVQATLASARQALPGDEATAYAAIAQIRARLAQSDGWERTTARSARRACTGVQGSPAAGDDMRYACCKCETRTARLTNERMRMISTIAQKSSNAIDPTGTKKAAEGLIGSSRIVASAASLKMQTTSAVVAMPDSRQK